MLEVGSSTLFDFNWAFRHPAVYQLASPFGWNLEGWDGVGILWKQNCDSLGLGGPGREVKGLWSIRGTEAEALGAECVLITLLRNPGT